MADGEEAGAQPQVMNIPNYERTNGDVIINIVVTDAERAWACAKDVGAWLQSTAMGKGMVQAVGGTPGQVGASFQLTTREMRRNPHYDGPHHHHHGVGLGTHQRMNHYYHGGMHGGMYGGAYRERIESLRVSVTGIDEATKTLTIQTLYTLDRQQPLQGVGSISVSELPQQGTFLVQYKRTDPTQQLFGAVNTPPAQGSKSSCCCLGGFSLAGLATMGANYDTGAEATALRHHFQTYAPRDLSAQPMMVVQQPAVLAPGIGMAPLLGPGMMF